MSGYGAGIKAGITLVKSAATSIAAGTKSAASATTTTIRPSLGAGKSAGTGATTVAKGSDDAALAATKAGTGAGAAGAAGAAKTGLTTGAKNADEAGKAAIKNADDAAASSAKQAGKQTDEAVKAKASMLSKVATVGSVAVSALALKSYFEKNGKLYNIISIDDVSDDDTNIKTQITIFSGGDKFSKNDTIEIKDTDCVPDITGSYGIFEIISNDKYIIITPSKITTKGTKGEVKLLTTFENVFADTLKDALGSTVGVAKDGIGAILEELGISPEKMWIIIYVVIGIIGLLILYKIWKIFA